MDEEDIKQEEDELEKLQEIDESNRTAHATGKAIATHYGGTKGARLYNAYSKTKMGQATERQLGNKIRRNPVTNALSKKINKSGLLGKSSSIKSGAAGATNGASAASSDYDLADKAKVKIKVPKLSTPIIVFLIITFSFIFLLIFISVLLPGIDYLDGSMNSQSSHISYLSEIKSSCESVVVDKKSVPIEDYIATVVASEIGNDAPHEAKKALAIVARNYVIKNTNTCSNDVPSTDAEFLLYNKNITPNQDTINAVLETKSQNIYLNNSLVNTTHDNFCTVEETRSDGTGGYKCDSNSCQVTYAKVGSTGKSTGEIFTIKVPASYKNKFTGGDCYGMSTIATVYMANIGNNAEEILKTFYGDEIVIESYAQVGGLEATDNANYFARTSRATRDNAYYYNQSTGLAANGLEGECAWYGLCRAQEILATSGSSKKFSRGGNGGEFCSVAQSLPDNFTIVKDYSKPKAGSLVVWSGGAGGYGHVAVVEKILDDNTIFISEAGISYGKFGRAATDLLWTNGTQYDTINAQYGSNALARKANCEGNNSGCQSFKAVSISNIKNYSGLNFTCYVYLLDD
mgnify:FL=1